MRARPRRYLLLLNIRSGNAKAFLKQLTQLDCSDIEIVCDEFDVLEQRFLRQISQDTREVVILVAGGDGTLGGLLRHVAGSPSQPKIGIAPTGTVNVFASSIGITDDALDTVRHRDALVSRKIFILQIGSTICLTAACVDKNSPFLFQARELFRTRNYAKAIHSLGRFVSLVYLASGCNGLSKVTVNFNGKTVSLCGRIVIISPATMRPRRMRLRRVLVAPVITMVRDTFGFAHGAPILTVLAGRFGLPSLPKTIWGAVSGTWDQLDTNRLVQIPLGPSDVFEIEIPPSGLFIDGEACALSGRQACRLIQLTVLG